MPINGKFFFNKFGGNLYNRLNLAPIIAILQLKDQFAKFCSFRVISTVRQRDDLIPYEHPKPNLPANCREFLRGLISGSLMKRGWSFPQKHCTIFASSGDCFVIRTVSKIRDNADVSCYCYLVFFQWWYPTNLPLYHSKWRLRFHPYYTLNLVNLNNRWVDQ